MSFRVKFEAVDGAYTMSDADIEMLARALWGEKRSQPPYLEMQSMSWAWMNRFMLWPGKGPKKWGNLWQLIQAHSQPVNPAWLAGGKFCLPGGKGYKTQWCSGARCEWRDKVQHAAWDDVPAWAREFAAEFAAGKVDPVSPPWVNFASNDYAVTHGVCVAGGEYYLDKQSDTMSGWRPGDVSLGGLVAYRSAPDSVLAALIILGVVGALIYFTT